MQIDYRERVNNICLTTDIYKSNRDIQGDGQQGTQVERWALKFAGLSNNSQNICHQLLKCLALPVITGRVCNDNLLRKAAFTGQFSTTFTVDDQVRA